MFYSVDATKATDLLTCEQYKPVGDVREGVEQKIAQVMKCLFRYVYGEASTEGGASLHNRPLICKILGIYVCTDTQYSTTTSTMSPLGISAYPGI